MSKIKFGPDTNYDNVLDITKKIFGDVVAQQEDCCGNIAVDTAVCKTAANIDAANLAKTSTPPNVERYQRAVKYAYLTIYPFATNDYNP